MNAQLIIDNYEIHSSGEICEEIKKLYEKYNYNNDFFKKYFSIQIENYQEKYTKQTSNKIKKFRDDIYKTVDNFTKNNMFSVKSQKLVVRIPEKYNEKLQTLFKNVCTYGTIFTNKQIHGFYKNDINIKFSSTQYIPKINHENFPKNKTITIARDKYKIYKTMMDNRYIFKMIIMGVVREKNKKNNDLTYIKTFNGHNKEYLIDDLDEKLKNLNYLLSMISEKQGKKDLIIYKINDRRLYYY